MHSSEIAREEVLLVYARDGRAAMIVEGQFDLPCLGTGRHPSSKANMLELARTLRDRAPDAFHDDRLLRLGVRQLPFVIEAESGSRSRAMSVLRRDTRASLDVLAEILHRAVVEGFLG